VEVQLVEELLEVGEQLQLEQQLVGRQLGVGVQLVEEDLAE